MDFVTLQKSNGVATLTLNRGKVNALNAAVVDQLRTRLKDLEVDREAAVVILIGAGKFFSFGFDIPEFLSFTKQEFTEYLTNFADLYTYLFLYSKPVVAALNGHTMAGGCMLALACDHRVMTAGNAKIALNEIGFGSSVFAGSTEMLRFWVGSANATAVLYSGAMYQADEAERLGLINEVATEDRFATAVADAAAALKEKSAPAFASIKSLLRMPVAEEMRQREASSIRDFVDIWYSDRTWANLQKIKIY
jgi:Delta3-Delta2-enoyl-CoA isomerase